MAPATRKSKRAAAAAAPKQEEPASIEEPEERAPKKKKDDPETTPADSELADIAQTEQEESLGQTADAFVESQTLTPDNDAEAIPRGGEDETAIEVLEEAEEHTAEEIPRGGEDETAVEVLEEVEEHTADENGQEEEEGEEEVAEGEREKQEEGDEEVLEEVEEVTEEAEEVSEGAEEIKEDSSRLGLDVEGEAVDDRIGDVDDRIGDDDSIGDVDGRIGDDDEDFEGPGSTQVPDEKQGEEAAVATRNNGSSSPDGALKNATSAVREDEAFPSQGKIFIGGLTWETTADTLQNHFGKYGEITDSVVMKNRNTGHPRGFGFVTFADPSVCDTVLKETHVIDGRTVEAKQTVPREKGPASSKGPKSKKIFVGGLTSTTTEEELKAYFEKFGKVVEHQIMQDHKTGRSRGFGFVTFDCEEVVDNILAQGRLLELGGKQVEIKRAEPKRAGQESFAGSSSSGRPFTGRGGGFSRGYGAYDPYLARGGGFNSRGGGGRPGGHPYGDAYRYGGPYGDGAVDDAYRYGGGYGGPYGYGAVDDGYGGLGHNYTTFGSGPGYGYNFNGSYGGSARGYGGNNLRYHPYSR